MLGSKQITDLLRTKWAGCNIVYKDITGSTNDDAKELAAAGAVHGTLVVADRQDTGRGSRGRSWETPAGSNIAMSLIVRPSIPIDRVSMLTLVMGLSVAEGVDAAVIETGCSVDDSAAGEVESVGAGIATTDVCIDALGDGSGCGIKWPNDVVLEGRKICGILTELHMNPDGTIGDVVIGVGINVNMKAEDFDDSIREFAGSLLTGTGRRTYRSLVVARVMERFEANYEKFVESSDLSQLKDQYEARLVNRDREVMLVNGDRTPEVAGKEAVEQCFAEYPERGAEDRFCECEERGMAIGISDMGALRVRMDSGMIREVNAGEVSVRGLYGYV